jgi:DNA-directed RNA polymerase specialized sigma24 family protein
MDEEALFASALEKATPAEREAFLARACGADDALRRRVERLLASHEKAVGILERGPEAGGPGEEPLALHKALEQFAAHDPLRAKLVELRFFGGLTLAEAAECLGISPSTADRGWRYARAWLYAAMSGDGPEKK